MTFKLPFTESNRTISGQPLALFKHFPFITNNIFFGVSKDLSEPKLDNKKKHKWIVFARR